MGLTFLPLYQTQRGKKINKNVTVCFSSVSSVQLCPTLCDPMDCSTPGFPVLIKHQIILENQVTPCHRAVRGEEMQNLMTVIQECL